MDTAEKRNRFYEETLPEGYTEAKTVDAESGDTGQKMQRTMMIITAVLIAAIWFIYARPRYSEIAERFSLASCFAFFAAYMVYIILHELTHGAVYMMLTKHKLTFGFKPPVAYCGVLGIYTYRITSMLSLFAPLTVFTAVFAAAFFLVSDPYIRLIILILGALHLTGCSGDVYNIWLFLTRFRDPSVLRLDLGPKQIYYTKSEAAGEDR